MLVPPIQTEKLAAFSLTSLEKDLRHDLMVMPDLGIPVSLLDIQRYSVPDVPQQLHADDKALIEGVEDMRGGAGGPRRASAKRLDGDLSWLMRTTYIANDLSVKRRLASGAASAAKRQQEEGDMLEELTDRDVQVAAILRTFDAAQKVPVHPKNPDLVPVEVLPLLPDFERGCYQYVDVQFEDCPVSDLPSLASVDEETRTWAAEHSLMTYKINNREGVALEYVAHLVPKDLPGTTTSEREYDSFEYAREYAFDVKHTDKGRAYLLTFEEDAGRVVYDELSTRLELRRPGAEGKKMLEQETEVPLEYRLYKRKMLSSEVEKHAKRMREELGWDDQVVDEVVAGMDVASEGEEEEGGLGGSQHDVHATPAGRRRIRQAVEDLEDEEEEEEDDY